MRPLYLSLALAAFILSACGTVTTTPEPLPATFVPVSTPVPPTATHRPQRMSLLRIAVLGETTTTNVWALFDEAGTDYWSSATQVAYWPSLYRLAPPSLDLQPATALGQPSPLECGSAPCIATVTLQPNLKWTNASPFSARDVVFTVNTALQFRLGLNWQRTYNPDVLDHAELLDRNTVKFYFKTRPTVADWQYGVLLGPVVNQAYWQPRITDAIDLLPDEALLPAILELEGEFAQKQAEVEALNLSLNTMVPGSTEYTDTSRDAQSLQDDLNSVYNKLEKNRSEYETKLSEARASLFELDNSNEPTLGPWKFASDAEKSYENQVNLGTPFGNPWFDSVRYVTYPNESAAAGALLNDEVDIILTPDGLSHGAVSKLINNPEIMLSSNMTRSARFLTFNHANPDLADPILHQALACMIDPKILMENLGDDTAPLSGFTLDEFWHYKEASLPCTGLSADARLAEAIRLFKSAGYSWEDEPFPDAVGSELRSPSGSALPGFKLLTPQQDPIRDTAADYIAQQAQILGLSIEAKVVDSDELFYEVYGSRNYDMALLGWSLSVYPSYLCDWFLPSEQNPFGYYGSNLAAACEAWNQVSDLETAKTHANEVQSILMRDLPLIPLYTGVRVDAYRNVRYPFAEVVDGLGDLYGAPALAIPIP